MEYIIIFTMFYYTTRIHHISLVRSSKH